MGSRFFSVQDLLMILSKKGKKDAEWKHVLPIKPRLHVYKDGGLKLNKLEEMLQRYWTQRPVSRPFAWLTIPSPVKIKEKTVITSEGTSRQPV